MGYNDNDLPRTKVGMRGKMLVAWLAEATPPILWRFVANDVSGGFSLRHAEGKIELVQYDGGTNPHVIAIFSSEASAERALSRLSRTLLSYKAPWKKAVKWGGAIFALLILFLGLRLMAAYQAKAAMQQLQALSSHYPSNSAVNATPPLMLPGTPPVGSTPPANNAPMGSPIDVDKFYK